MRTFLLLKHNSLIVFPEDGSPQQCVFPQEIVKHQEIVDHEGFEKLLDKFFSQFSKDKAVLFLSHEVVFAKKVSITPETVIEDEKKKFTDLVPLPPSTVEAITLETESIIYFFATNSDLYTTIITLAEQYELHITHVVPLQLFGPLPEKEVLSFDFFSDIAKEKDLIKQGDFLKPQIVHSPTKRLPVKQLVSLTVALLIFICSLLFAALNLGFIDLPSSQGQKPQAKQVTPTTKPAALPTITEATSSKKEDLKIQVLNGSGVAGQAGEIKKQLEAIEFTNIQTGNAEGPTANATIVVFSKKVPKTYQEEIISELKKTFTTIETQPTSEDSNYDISITTGEIKEVLN